jgi:tRNA pseudouridine38/39 synthase
MMTAKLISSPGAANYSRCGRTDAGVSATGQVLGCTLRTSSNKIVDGKGDLEISLPIGIILNSLLPPEIRVIGITDAPEGFNARFDCKYREYNYYFPRGNLDIDAMIRAASLLKGTHDFRNFCKKDPSKDVENFERTILESRIESLNPTDDARPDAMFKFVIRGTAFLYHQVRCTMAVLYLVGEGKEVPEVVEYLTAKENLLEDWRPTYQMASEIPLVLVDCGFDSIEFEDVGQESWREEMQKRTQKHFWGLWKDKMNQMLTINSLLNLSNPLIVKPSENQVFSYKLRR